MKKSCRERKLPYQSFKNHKYQFKGSVDVISIVLVTYEEQNIISFVINGVHLSIDTSLDDEYGSAILYWTGLIRAEEDKIFQKSQT